MAKIYADLEDAAADSEVDALNDDEADRLLVRLEAAYARFRDGVFRTWPRPRQYAFDRQALLFQSGQLRREIMICAGGLDGLTDAEVADVCKALAANLKRQQTEMVRLRLAHYSAQGAGSA